MENYKQKYEAALEQAKQELKACGSLNCDAARQIFRLFPELKKSEDELIKEELIHFLETCQDTRFVGNRKRDKWIAWLEKQGEKEKTPCDRCRKEQPSHSCQDITSLGRCYMEGEQKPTDEFKPKFKVGDWVVQNGVGIYKIVEVCESWYEVISNNDGMQYSIGFDKENDCRLWSIKDAKDGDILVDGSRVFIYREHDDSSIQYYASFYPKGKNKLLFEGAFFVNHNIIKNIHPATTEQRDLLFKKMKEAGYEWDSNKKELIKP